MNTQSKIILTLGIIGVLLGMICFYDGIDETKKAIFIQETFSQTTGTIYNIKTESLSVDLPTPIDYLQIEFSLPNKQKIQFTTDYSLENYKYNIGDVVPIYYNPHNPKNAYNADFGIIFLSGALSLFTGTILILFAGQYVVKIFFRKNFIKQN